MTTVLLVAYVGALGYGTVRPGCSLLLVVRPAASDRTLPGTAQQACAALGASMPRPHYLSDGFRQLGRGVSGPHPPGLEGSQWANVRTPGAVNVSYGREQATMLLSAMATRTVEPLPDSPAVQVSGAAAAAAGDRSIDGRRAVLC